MARTKEFDENIALENAMFVFWSKGYQATTPQNLLDAMGLSKSSFYDTYKSKHELLLRCLNLYINSVVDYVTDSLTKTNSTNAIRVIYTNMIEHATKPGHRNGCLLFNTATELSPHDPEVECIVKDGLTRLENAYHKFIIRSQKSGHINKHYDPKSLAKFLVINIGGIEVMSKANPDKASLNKVVKIIISSLK